MKKLVTLLSQCPFLLLTRQLGPVVQSIVSLTTPLGKDSISFTVLIKLIAVIFFAEKLLGDFSSYTLENLRSH